LRLGLDTYSYRHAAGLWDYVPRENAAMGVDHFLQKAADLDLDGVHLADARHLDSLEYGYVSELRRKAEDHGLYMELGTGGTNPEHLESMVRAAHVLASPVVRTFVGRPRPATSQEMERVISEAAAEIRQVLPVCDRYGIGLAIENHQDLTTDELLSLLELIDSQWVGICFDTGNSLALLDDPLESARAFGPLVRTVHLKDYQVAARADGFCLVGCALGEGVVDLGAVLEVLSREAPEANLNIEAYIGKHAVPALDDEYLRRVPEVSAQALGRTLRLVRDRGLPREPSLLTDRGAPEAEILAAEEELVARSARWARQALRRPGPEAGSGDE
jgi:sugar phosphate isomerase/epimerase